MSSALRLPSPPSAPVLLAPPRPGQSSMPHATDAARCPFWRPWEDCTQRDNTVMTAALHTSGSSPASCSAQPTLACSPLERLSLTASLAPLLANRTIQFLGDSVQTQLFAAFACRLHAMGWRYTGRLNWLSTRSKWGVRRRVKSQLCAGREDMCHYESGCITELSIGSTICVSQIIALPSPEVLSYLSTQRLRRRRDVLMYGTVGAHLTQLERTSAGALRPVIASWQEDAAREVAPVHMALRAALQRNPRLARDDRDALRLDTERIVPPRRRGKREVRGAPARRHAGGCSWARSVERLDRTSRENARHCDAAPLGELCPCVVWPRWRGVHWRRQERQSDGGGLRSLLPCSDLAVGGHTGTQDCLG